MICEHSLIALILASDQSLTRVSLSTAPRWIRVHPREFAGY